MMKDIPGYENLYAAESDGRIWSHRSQKYLVLCDDKNGYKRVNLAKFKKIKTWRVHNLIAKTFISNPKEYQQINHLDGNKWNNDIRNLEWCDNKTNKMHAWKNGFVNKERDKFGRFKS